jgi:hypothetical protein
MLRANEFVVGTLENAEPLSLMLPQSKYGRTFLIGRIEEAPGAVLLDTRNEFVAFPCAGAGNWRGLLIPHIRIEIDQASMFEPDFRLAPGALMRLDTRLIVGAKSDRHIGLGTQVVLESGLAPTHEGSSAAFSRWSIVIGKGQDRRVLRSVDANIKAGEL